MNGKIEDGTECVKTRSQLMSNRYWYSITGLDGPLWLQEVETPRIYRQLSHESGVVVSPKHRPPLSSRDIPGWADPRARERPQGLSQCKIPKARDLPACSPVLQPTSPPRTPVFWAWRGHRNTALQQVAHDYFSTHCARWPVVTTSFGWLLHATAECRL